ncbi:hypothetical protein [Coraliomargarita akajimensis]|uniref:PEP-CTERM protein-sorting domain-containing protein n=1 Tax=Coraliomargarita akajimensis (strain DSM 45221 / IAM 15411 / JCM 23193 / KCTC 12865 / 04OKA010-24) TaxID=583355 RepID=D5EQ87_CORAD|nr:hypothetical protein [Coraliomargarita akajimensis]ADE53855.1 hypothetical protein Caka_0831 [Coraliomargarita akajimensis DSM 45221]
MKPNYLLLSSLLAGATALNGAEVITAFTTNPVWPSDGALDSYTAGGVTYSSITSISGYSAAPSTTTVWNSGSTAPTDVLAAYTDNRVDTGSLGATASVTYNFANAFSAGDQIVVFFNAGAATSFQSTATIEAVDGTGTTVGSIVDLSSLVYGTDVGTALGSYTMSRNNGGDLAGRLIGGFSVDVSEFGGNIADITGIKMVGGAADFANANSMDYTFIGQAAVPEVSSFAAIAGMAALGLVTLRRRR